MARSDIEISGGNFPCEIEKHDATKLEVVKALGEKSLEVHLYPQALSGRWWKPRNGLNS